jgi:hypothetical protein
VRIGSVPAAHEFSFEVFFSQSISLSAQDASIELTSTG